MTRLTAGACLWTLALTCGPAAAQEVPPKPVDSPIRWLYRYDEGKEEARRTGKPLFVVFRCER